MKRKTFIWNEENEKKLKELYPTISNIDLADYFGTSLKSIEAKAGRLKLKKTKEARSAIQREFHDHIKSKPFLEYDGVKYIYMPKHPYCNYRGYVSEQRLVMEEKLQRYLNENEAVIHKNGDKSDNSPDNLEVKYYYRLDVEPLDVYNDRMNGMPVEDIKKKYGITNNTYYRKLDKAKLEIERQGEHGKS